MVRFLAVALVFAAFVAFGAAQVPDSLKEELEACKSSFNVTDEDIKSINEKQAPTSTEGKCYLHCIFWKLDMMTEEGKMNPEGFKTFVRQIPDLSEEDKGKMEKVADRCGRTPLTDDKCEDAVVIFNCINAEAEEMGVKGP